jgi:phage/plasmid-associated DNA primase
MPGMGQRHVERFIHKVCVLEDDAETPTAKLYEAYVRWRRAKGSPPLRLQPFAQRLSQAGIRTRKAARGERVRVGIRLCGEGVAPTASRCRRSISGRRQRGGGLGWSRSTGSRKACCRR